MKRLLSFALILCLGAGMLCLPCAAAQDYVFPDDWSRDALVFAVENGILAGDENKNLHPTDYITRAEMAAVLVRLLGGRESADLSAYEDVKTSDWFHGEMSRAVALGIFNGVSPTQIQPKHNITREQAAVVLCRAFGLVSSNTEAWKEFTDYIRISDYARESLATLKSMGLANGYEDGSYQPKSSITRAEVAQLLYNIFDCIADSPEEIPAKGWVLYRGSEALPEHLELDGTLILGQNVPTDLAPKDWKISGSLILRCGRNTQAKLKSVRASNVVCAALSGSYELSKGHIWLWNKGCQVKGSGDGLTVLDGKHSAEGSFDAVLLRAGQLHLTGEADEAVLREKTLLELDGPARKITMDGRWATLKGSGHTETLVLNYSFCDISLSYDRLDDSWYQSYQKDFDRAPDTVQPMRVPIKLYGKTSLYSSMGSGYLGTLEADCLVYNEWNPDGDWIYVSTADGRWGWIRRGSGRVMTNDPGAYDGTLDYSQATKEGFVNMGGYSSKTEYLVWASCYTQKVMVFQGCKDNWKLIKTFPCASGSTFTPTPRGVYVIEAYSSGFSYDDYYVKTATCFYGDHAFHSILYRYDGSVYDGTLGEPRSHGCVRMAQSDAEYMNDLPLNTCVIIH